FVVQLSLVQTGRDGMQGADGFGGIQVILQGRKYRVILRQLIVGVGHYRFAATEQRIVKRIQRAFRLLQKLFAEIQRRAIVGRQQRKAQYFAAIMLEQFAHQAEVAERLRHLLAIDIDIAIVQSVSQILGGLEER